MSIFNKILKIILIVVGCIFVFTIILYKGRPANIFNPCLDYEKTLPIPDFVKDKQISFRSPMEYVSGLTSEYGLCTPIMKEVGRLLKANDPQRPNQYQTKDFNDGKINITPVSSNSVFKVVGAFETIPTVIITDSESNTYLILEDQNGVRSIKYSSFSSYSEKPFYLDTGQDLVVPKKYQ